MLLQGNQGQTGKQSGQNITAGLGEYSDQLVSELQARYYQQSYRGNVFIGSPPAVLTWAAGLTTTAVVAAIANPPTSGKNLVLLSVGFCNTSTTASVAALSFQTFSSALSATTTSFLIANAFVGNGAATVARSTLTLQSTPVVGPIIANMSTSAITQMMGQVDLGGAYIIGQGCAVALELTAAGTGWASLTWVEVPV